MPRKARAPNDDPSEFSIDAGAARIRMRKNPQPHELFDAKQTPQKKRTDLRKLSEWIKAQRRAAEAQRTPATDSRPGKQYVLFMPVGHLTAVIASAWRKLAGTK
jgi:hypothetical protein